MFSDLLITASFAFVVLFNIFFDEIKCIKLACAICILLFIFRNLCAILFPKPGEVVLSCLEAT
jgi:tryptophan-rich sensory protein